MQKSDFSFIAKIFLGWLALLFIILFFAVKFIPIQTNFLGGGLLNYLKNPYFWAWGNFDGEHYVSIAMRGYGFGERAFFPLYSILISFFGKVFGGSLASFNFSGILISLISFFVGLIGFYKLVRLDYSERIARISTILLLLFPTSFYFAGIYTESLFFVLAVWSLYFARRGKWSRAVVFGIFLTATRFVGLIIFPVILIEWFTQSRKEKNFLKTFPFLTLTIPAGLLAYMYYLQKTIGNAFAFYTELSNFGQQRSSHLITLPQVYYRYIFEILPNLHTVFFPVIFTTIFEFAIGVIYLLISLFAFFKIRLSYAAFIFFGYLIPTFSGSFSSLPRYVLVLFPVFILFGLIGSKSKVFLFLFEGISFILLIVSFSLFARGYWIS